ncbi:hypothetical protein [Curtanaerobium respiraculi]|uniref:hypothetical protein n=1 Tax=Curtanaerobium respiraculi TaxID=2949669 RepID=UPI0024B3983E|nr:hypothetical protein [Curtanaerobium respiraculi]
MAEDNKFLDENEACKQAQRIVSKYGYTILCDDDEVDNAIVVAEGCESFQEAVDRWGLQYTILCDDGTVHEKGGK